MTSQARNCLSDDCGSGRKSIGAKDAVVGLNVWTHRNEENQLRTEKTYTSHAKTGLSYDRRSTKFGFAKRMGSWRGTDADYCWKRKLQKSSQRLVSGEEGFTRLYLLRR